MTMTQPPGNPAEPSGAQVAPQLLLGLLVIGAGVLFLLHNIGIINALRYLRYWPAALILVGILKIWQSRDGLRGAFGGFIFTVAGVWLLLEELALVRIPLADLWPLMLVLFGIYLVWHAVAGPRPERGAETDTIVNAVAVLAGVSRGSNSRAFRGGSLTAFMGGCELDLRHAAIHGQADIDVFAMWGGIDIRVPDDWSVQSRIVPLLGGVDDKTRAPQGATTHRLVLRGFAIMGGVEVKN